MTTTVWMTMLRVAVAALFGVAGAAKLRNPASARTAVQAVGVPRRAEGVATRLLPALELTVAGWLALSSSPAAARAALGLITLLTMGLGVAALRGKSDNCGCFGRRPSSIGWRAVARNAGIAAASVVLYLAAV